MKRSLSIVLCAVACGAVHDACAHGFAGKRFFPATIATEDPFVADELSLPTYSHRKFDATEDEPGTTESATSIDYTKRITENFGLGFGATYLYHKDEDGTTHKGFDNLAANAKYQFYKNDAAETILSAGVDWDIGNSGAKAVGAETFSTITPAIFFGKGFGDLPEDARMLRPFALTGSLGYAFPSRTQSTTTDDDGNTVVERHPDAVKLGLALEYSLPYLQSFVKDTGLGEPWNRLVPLIELSLEKPVNRGGGPTTGTVNPGVVWASRFVQLGFEAVIPVNSRSGGHTGVLLQLHFFMDDLFPHGAGAPLFK